ncbi:MAG: LytTR family DNA-binding domain-containing protein [Eubacteriales bacterium]|nr:LytTR family DNA-binding domain-containing protein [Eubacteriales bacterium]
MLRIAICDDMHDELLHITEFTNEYFTNSGISADIQQFSHPDELLKACETKTFHIFLLDIVMPMLSGLDLGHKIRLVNTDAQIIFITTEPGFALDAYTVNPLHYLLKPVEKNALFAALELATNKMNYGAEIIVTIKTKKDLRTISADSIACCEYVRHTVVYTLISGERIESSTISGSFTEHIQPVLADRRFLRPHAAFVVNMSQVERLSKEGFTLRRDIFVPISAKQFRVVRDAYMSYRLGGVW